MALDPYRSCPCGSGKKMKFCCSKDILSELDKVIRAIEGDQRAAALDQLGKLIESKGARPALLSLKASLQLSLSTLEDAEATIEQLAEQSPNNSIAIALQARLKGARGELDAAIEELQRSLEYADASVPASAISSAIGSIVQESLKEGRIQCARAHLLLEAMLGLTNGQDALNLLLRIDNAPSLYPLMKDDHNFEEVPANVPWAGEFRAAMHSVSRGAWRAACENLHSLAEKAPRQPTIIRAIAVLRGYLGQEEEAAKAWHEYATIADVPLNAAVEAEALALNLDDAQVDVVARIQRCFPIHDFDRVSERLLSDRRFVSIPFDPKEFPPDEPPPRSAFTIFDRHPPTADGALTAADIPLAVGVITLFGRETDREARIELMGVHESAVDAGQKTLQETLSDLLGALESSKDLGETLLEDWLFGDRWAIPQGVSADQARELIRAITRRVLLEEWTRFPRKILGGRSPLDVMGDPAYRIPLLGAILDLEYSKETVLTFDDCNGLRQRLGLPQTERIDPSGMDPQSVSIGTLRRIDVSKVADNQFDALLAKAVVKGQNSVAYHMAAEMLSRGITGERFDRRGLYRLVVQNASDTDAALRWTLDAQSHATSAKESPAEWLIAELSLRIMRMESEELSRVLTTLKAKHWKEPGVAEAIRDVLARFGLLREPATGGQAPAAVPAAAATPEPQKIWTPDSVEAPAGETKSKLWVPGMD